MSDDTPQTRDEPDYEELRRSGWTISYSCGRYCVAWRGNEEVVMTWGPNGWRQVPGRGDLRSAA